MQDPGDGMVNRLILVRQTEWFSYARVDSLFLILFSYSTDPDMLEVGNAGMSYREHDAHFSTWALLKVSFLNF